jgi:hypothetical protein
LLAVARDMDPGTARARTLEAAAQHALAEIEAGRYWMLGTLAAIACEHPPATSRALEAARRCGDGARGDGARADLELQNRATALAILVGAVEPDARVGLASEAVDAAAQANSASTEWAVISIVARAAAGTCPDHVLALARRGNGRWERVSRVVPYLPAPQRDAAIDDVLGIDRAGSASPLQHIAPHLRAEQYPRALALAATMSNTRYFGAAAHRALLPGWAALGNTDDALDRARSIADPGERGIALAHIAPHASGSHQAIVREAFAAFQETPSAYDYEASSLARKTAAALVPLGYANRLLELAHHDTDTLTAVAVAADGDERARFVAELARRAGIVRMGAPLAAELPPAPLFETFLLALDELARRPLEDLIEDEYGLGLIDWVPFFRALGGAAALRPIAELFAACGA